MTMMANPDQSLILRFLAGEGEATPIDSNPLAVALGLTLRAADAQAGTISLDAAPAALFLQGAGVLQGGAVAALLDFAMAFAVMATLPAGARCATLGLEARFLRAARDARYRVEGQIDRRARSVAFTSARLFAGDENDVAASATSLLSIVGP